MPSATTTSRGLEVINVSGFGMDDDNEMTAVSPEAIVEAGVQAMAADADAPFILCARAARQPRRRRPSKWRWPSMVNPATRLSSGALRLRASPGWQAGGPGRLFDHARGTDSDAR